VRGGRDLARAGAMAKLGREPTARASRADAWTCMAASASPRSASAEKYCATRRSPRSTRARRSCSSTRSRARAARRLIESERPRR
jgi:hypothetical protein